jgi:hypothetical protein
MQAEEGQVRDVLILAAALTFPTLLRRMHRSSLAAFTAASLHESLAA